MKILQLCFFNEYKWNDHDIIESWDIKNGRDVNAFPLIHSTEFDLILASPPCDQFTKANSHNWQIYPARSLNVARKCLKICEFSGKPFIFETVPGRLEKLLPEIIKYRSLTWMSSITGKQHILYSNFLLLMPYRQEGNDHIKRSKTEREKWQPDLVSDIRNVIDFFR